MHGVATLSYCSVVLFASSWYLSTHFFAWPSMSQDHDSVSASSFTVAFVSDNFSVAPAEILESNILLLLSTISLLIWHSLWVQPKETWSRNDVGSTKTTFFMRIFQVGLMFCFFPASLISSTYTDKNNFFHGVRISIPNWIPSPNRILKDLSLIAFPTIVLPKDDRTDFVQEERLGLPYWTMIVAICALVDVSKYLDIFDFGIFHWRWCVFHFDVGVSGYYVSCLSCASWKSWFLIFLLLSTFYFLDVVDYNHAHFRWGAGSPGLQELLHR